ncbi:MAG: CaiB/BaiF CoA-transferase family protein [Limnobacter sp.]|nr:CaiB/BaiF CoA-transferase family protein [Limnobacter sp.]
MTRLSPVQDPDILKGIRVLDLSRNLPGPACSLMLMEMGATVVKIEPPHGDDAKAMPTLYQALNSGKEIITADFRTAEGIDCLIEQAGQADVLIEGFRPGVMGQMGCAYEALQRNNPKLVMCSITGYGQEGPLAHQAGHDINFLAQSGLLSRLKTADGQLAMPGMQLGDVFGGTAMATIGILAGLLKAQKTGQGSFVDISMTDGLRPLALLPDAMQRMWTTLTGKPMPHENDLLSGGLACYNLYETADGHTLVVGALEHRFWKLFVEAIGQPDWADIHWSKGAMPGTKEALDIRQKTRQLIAMKPLSHWLGLLKGVDCCVNSLKNQDKQQND